MYKLADGQYQNYFKRFYRPFTRALSPKSQFMLKMQQKSEVEKQMQIPELPPHEKPRMDLAQSQPTLTARMQLLKISGRPAPLTRTHDRMNRSMTLQTKLAKTHGTSSQFGTKSLESDWHE
ncbi:hypothetical protein SS50377_20397 [Spironucleus salmonicida]|uniref:Uncharacterized protein n=1 Tax=Spironucleus salmonicida TaxID=348837 RepID=V6LU99_9EUKA|nr:hypothetical protein SS50377_20397 [Spironucleus salmonicida]|eukprot:EST48192.1 Hypothetical protein SS50377_11630 [Spironucleus salmonicida]